MLGYFTDPYSSACRILKHNQVEGPTKNSSDEENQDTRRIENEFCTTEHLMEETFTDKECQVSKTQSYSLCNAFSINKFPVLIITFTIFTIL